jgi:hypothetical protein
LIAHGVTLRMPIEIVLTAIDLDDEPMLQANEINNEPVTRRLSSEMETTLPP